jgi:hypothetical protein
MTKVKQLWQENVTQFKFKVTSFTHDTYISAVSIVSRLKGICFHNFEIVL